MDLQLPNRPNLTKVKRTSKLRNRLAAKRKKIKNDEIIYLITFYLITIS
jgi:hypothetical protein